MLITFKSAASGDVMMFEENGKELLSVLGKDPDADKGIVTVEQLPRAIAALRAAVEADRSTNREQPDADEDGDRQPDDSIQLAQRALPLLELLERSLVDKVPVTWGV
ncbi:hypothetical protein AzCIB_2246 [Azoarcus sp. CIB]|uniref:DUF1840 domain-containing protein n=1 Tax=Aromatoleum sp. (strain CIB) TaxID=198107 RepID=UPI00067AD86B|nr:DUF1840 domain-containing protein [Azoarcus sp. CIB]AKU12141.1 hypothetical protein AzCIB_2246 [Azoarcus sp. CIB]